MGLLIPHNFPMESLVNDAKRLVVSTLVDRLTDGWHVIPDVGVLGSIDRQMDIVVAHERDGVAVIEVKGHRAQLEQGVWCSNGRPLNPSRPRKDAAASPSSARSFSANRIASLAGISTPRWLRSERFFSMT